MEQQQKVKFVKRPDKPRLYKEIATGFYFWMVSRSLVHIHNLDNYVAITRVNRLLGEDYSLNDVIFIIKEKDFKEQFKPIKLKE